MMKKMIASLCIGACLMTAPNAVSFGDSLDTAYIDIIFDKMEELPAKDKNRYADLLEIAFYDEESLEVLKKTYMSTLEGEYDDPESMIDALGLTDSEIKDNIERLKDWSRSDRMKLIKLVKNGDKKGLIALNKANGDDGSSEAGSTPSTGGGSAPIGGTVTRPTDPLPESAKPIREVLADKGYRTVALVAKPEAKKDFDDLRTHWSKQYVDFFTERGIIAGRSETEFAPNAPINRAEIVTLITRVVVDDPGKLEGQSKPARDVKSDDWYYGYIHQGLRIGFLEPDENGMISPVEQPARQEIIHMLVRTLEILGIEPEVEGVDLTQQFTDTAQIQQSYYNDIETAVALGWISGMGDGRLAPEEGITRGQIAAMLQRFYNTMLGEIEEVEG